MELFINRFWICLFISVPPIVFTGIGTEFNNFNVSDFLKHREKRTLIFEGGGQIKFTAGLSLPVQFEDPITWRSLDCSGDLHGGQYDIPTAPLYPWDKYESIFARSMRKLPHQDFNIQKIEEAAAEQYWADDSRFFVYMAVESYMNRKKIDSGRACLLRAICENAQIQHHVGIMAEILNVILTPGKEKIDVVYNSAYEAGKSGVDCLRMYHDCPMGSSILDKYWEFL